MSKNILVISCDIRETRAALIEDGIIAELHLERRGRQLSTVGNVYLGKVTRVLPGLQAAFIEIGQERAAFLHVEDLIRPDDFDEYLAGGRKHAREDNTKTIVSEEGEEAPAAEAAPPVSPEYQVPTKPKPRAASVPARRKTPSGAPGGDDLEATVAYPNWPHPPSKAGAPAAAPAGNGTTTMAKALSSGEDDSDPLASEPPSTGPETAPAPPSVEAVEAAASEHSLNSAPTLDELPNEDSTSSMPPAASARDASPSTPLPVVDADLEDEELDEEEDDEDEDEDEDEDDLVDSDDEEEDDEDEDEDEDDLVDSEPNLSGILLDESAPIIAAPASEPTVGEAPADESDEEDDDDLDLPPDMPGFTISDPGAPVPRAPAPDRAEAGGRRRGRRRGGSGEGRGGASEGRGGERGRGRRDDRRDGRGRGRGGRDGRSEGRDANDKRSPAPGRISKSTPIRDVVREGQEIIVQVTKDPIGTKGARCSSHISLPGRYVVYLPTIDHIGISKRIGSDKERARLREAINSMKPPSGGLIVRTVAEGLTKKQLKQDVGYLVRLWGEIARKREGAKAPEVLMSEIDLVLKVARDLFTDDVARIVIDDRTQYERLCRFVEMFAPDRVKDVEFYDEEEPIFDAYGIEDEIGRALSRKVPLPSGGYLIIDQAEALTAIDVNTGRFVGKGSKDMEETILKTNLEAVHEIAYQLRFRNIGGLIILDLIDMEKHSNREKVRRTLEDLLQKDKAKTTLNRISELGLIEMTRKRTRESLARLLNEPCLYCDGTGQVQSKETVAYEVLREIRRKRNSLAGYAIIVNAHPAVADVLNTTEHAALQDAENRFMRKITVVPRKEYHLEQFDLAGR
ncbi:MAG: Rne/Rng family ribonuclease [Polyangiaceae bacterium]